METSKLVYPELSYKITGISFLVHNELGRFAREKQYCDLFEVKLKNDRIDYKREYTVERTGNRIDFIIESKIIVEVKATPFLTKLDYYQVQRYLQILDLKLGLLINFSNRYLKPKRILKVQNKISRFE